jgi:hypothetical protein
MFKLLKDSELNNFMHLCYILTELIYRYPSDARRLVTNSSSLIIMRAISEISSKPIYKMDIQDCLLFYCRIACSYLDCIG